MGIWDALTGGKGIFGVVGEIIGKFKLDPETKAKLEAAVQEQAFELSKMDAQYREKALELDGKLAEQAGMTLRAEIASSGWLGRNWRPVTALGFGTAFVSNIWLPLLAQFSSRFASVKPVEIPLEITVLFGFAFLGYGGLRTWEKIAEARLNAVKR